MAPASSVSVPAYFHRPVPATLPPSETPPPTIPAHSTVTPKSVMLPQPAGQEFCVSGSDSRPPTNMLGLCMRRGRMKESS